MQQTGTEFTHEGIALANAVERCLGRLAGDWVPLERVMPPDLCRHFMFMGNQTAPDGTKLWLYKDYIGRGYLNLDTDCNAWRYRGRDGVYEPQDLREALAHVLPDIVDHNQSDAEEQFIIREKVLHAEPTPIELIGRGVIDLQKQGGELNDPADLIMRAVAAASMRGYGVES